MEQSARDDQGFFGQGHEGQFCLHAWRDRAEGFADPYSPGDAHYYFHHAEFCSEIFSFNKISFCFCVGENKYVERWSVAILLISSGIFIS